MSIGILLVRSAAAPERAALVRVSGTPASECCAARRSWVSVQVPNWTVTLVEMFESPVFQPCVRSWNSKMLEFPVNPAPSADVAARSVSHPVHVGRVPAARTRIRPSVLARSVPTVRAQPCVLNALRDAYTFDGKWRVSTSR